MSYCVTITGPMFAGKTSALINIIRDLKKNKISYIVFKHAIDVRYEDNKICSHDRDTEQCISITEPINILQHEYYNKADVIIIEEVQFFNDTILTTIDQIKCDGKKLILSGLSGSFKQKAIGHMGDIYAKSEQIVQLSAICHYCTNMTPAHFTAKISGTDDVIEVGNDIYKPVCQYHYNLHSLVHNN